MTSLIAVVGATGKQGGSVARSLLANTSFRVRAITRNPDSETSQSLASLGTELFKADGFVRKEILAAFKNVWGAFINLNSDDSIWKNDAGPTEFYLGKIIIDAAAEAGVQHIVYSSGPPCTAMTNGQVSMKAMDSKRRTSRYLYGLILTIPSEVQGRAVRKAAWQISDCNASKCRVVPGELSNQGGCSSLRRISLFPR